MGIILIQCKCFARKLHIAFYLKPLLHSYNNDIIRSWFNGVNNNLILSKANFMGNKNKQDRLHHSFNYGL